MFGSLLLAFTAGALAIACAWTRTKFTRPTLTDRDTPEKGHPSDPITLYGFALPRPSGDEARSPSPFVTRLAAWLRFANIPFTFEGISDISKAPKGQVPFIKHGNTVVADSALTIKYLKATYGDPPANSFLMKPNPQQQALSTALIALALDRIAYVMAYHRFAVDAGWRRFSFIFSFLPKIIQLVLLPTFRAKGTALLHNQGFGRHSKHDVNLLLQDDLQALSITLGNKSFLLGDAPCDADAAVFAILDLLVSGRTVSPELNAITQQYPNLCQYVKRIHDQYFPEGPLAQPAKGKKA